jgi:RNA polymerase sigma factor (sigma-70 family)
MDDLTWLAERFEQDRAHLQAVAYRMLGSLNEAEDAVQESWFRLGRAEVSGIDNLSGWMTTVTARVCLDMLRARRSRREEPVLPDATVDHAQSIDPEQEAVLADSVGLALLVVLDALAPAERLAFVLHDMFGVPFDEIALLAGRSPAAARQLASRARRCVHGTASLPAVDLHRQRHVVDAFLTASRAGDFNALLNVLDPDVVFRSDGVGGPTWPSELRGAPDVAAQFVGQAALARPALVNGALGVVVAPRGRLLVVLELTITGSRIASIDAVADPARLRQIELAVADR